MPKGGELKITSALSYRPTATPSPPLPSEAEMLPFIKVTITDTGQGIPPDLLGRIFDPFFSTKEKGVGLGMAIAHRVIEDHKGFIEVSSTLAGGTTFTVSLPVPTAGSPRPA
jgi:signal transduction histidine kinase